MYFSEMSALELECSSYQIISSSPRCKTNLMKAITSTGLEQHMNKIQKQSYWISQRTGFIILPVVFVSRSKCITLNIFYIINTTCEFNPVPTKTMKRFIFLTRWRISNKSNDICIHQERDLHSQIICEPVVCLSIFSFQHINHFSLTRMYLPTRLTCSKVRFNIVLWQWKNCSVSVHIYNWHDLASFYKNK